MSTFVFVAFMVFGWLFPASVSCLLLNAAVPIYSFTEIEPRASVINAGGECFIKNSSSALASMRNGIPIDCNIYAALRSNKATYTVQCEMYYGLFGLAEFKSAELVLDSGQTLAL